MMDRTFPRRNADPLPVLIGFLDWISRLLALYWILKRLQSGAESRRLLLFCLKGVRWITIMRYSLPRRKLPASWYSVSIPLKAIGSPFLNLMNGIYLRLAFKYDPMAWYEWDSLFPWSMNWELPSTFRSLRFTLKPIQPSKSVLVALLRRTHRDTLGDV
jgi:hypothetical protein